MAGTLPATGLASTYSDYFVGRQTADSTKRHPDRYSHNAYTCALLKGYHGDVPFGTRLRLSYRGRQVVVRVSDTGYGSPQQSRVLDLSRIAMATLLGTTVDQITDRSARVIMLDNIEIVGPGVPLGPNH